MDNLTYRYRHTFKKNNFNKPGVHPQLAVVEMKRYTMIYTQKNSLVVKKWCGPVQNGLRR